MENTSEVRFSELFEYISKIARIPEMRLDVFVKFLEPVDSKGKDCKNENIDILKTLSLNL